MMQNIHKYVVNNEMIWTGELFKVNGTYQETPVRFYIRPLNVNDAEAMGDFSKTIYENLRAGEECFIHKHTKEYYHQIFENPQVHYFGAFVGSKLVGMSYITICENEAQLREELPNAQYNFFANERNDGKTKIASMGADSVLPEFRGNKLNTIMIDYRLEQAKKYACTDCTSIVDRNNKWNMVPYFSCKFNLFETTIDPSDNGKISLLHRPIENEEVLTNSKSRLSLPYNRLDLIDKMIERGYIGIDFNKETATVLFAKSPYYAQQKLQPINTILYLYQKKYRKII